MVTAQTKKKIEKANKLIEKGMRVKVAVKMADISYDRYKRASKRLELESIYGHIPGIGKPMRQSVYAPRPQK